MKRTLATGLLAATLATATVAAQAQSLPAADLVPQMSSQSIGADSLGTSQGIVVPILTALIILLILSHGASGGGVPVLQEGVVITPG